MKSLEFSPRPERRIDDNNRRNFMKETTMNTAEKNMLYELVNQLRSNITILRATLNLALDHDKALVPFIRDALQLNEEKMDRAYKLIDKRYE